MRDSVLLLAALPAGGSLLYFAAPAAGNLLHRQQRPARQLCNTTAVSVLRRTAFVVQEVHVRTAAATFGAASMLGWCVHSVASR
jgi:hypothetical protein